MSEYILALIQGKEKIVQYFFSSKMNKNPKRKKVALWTGNRNKEELQSENYKTLPLKAQFCDKVGSRYFIQNPCRSIRLYVINFQTTFPAFSCYSPAHSLLQAHWPFHSSTVPTSFLPQGLCTGCACYLKHSYHTFVCLFVIIQVSTQITISEAFLDQPLWRSPGTFNLPPSHHLVFSIAHLAIWNYICSRPLL